MRDCSGALRRQLEANGGFADGILDFTEVQQLLDSVLAAQSNPVFFEFMPHSSHAYVAGAGWEVFLAAFPKAARKGDAPGCGKTACGPLAAATGAVSLARPASMIPRSRTTR